MIMAMMKLMLFAIFLYYIVGVSSWVLFTLYFEDEDVTVGKFLFCVLFLWAVWPLTVRRAYRDKIRRKVRRITGKALFKKKQQKVS